MFTYFFGLNDDRGVWGETLTYYLDLSTDEFKDICNDVYKQLNRQDEDVEDYFAQAVKMMEKRGFTRHFDRASYVIDGRKPFEPVK